MKIIKLSAINSTNSFLKEMVSDSMVDDFTVVVAKKQTSGRGQMDTKWVSENGKNLIMSVFCKFSELFIAQQKFLNYAVSISVFEAVKNYKPPKLAIKWPNDILSEKDKIGGILIENSLKKDKIQSSVVGVGLNVNQEVFPVDLPNASSIKKKINKEVDLEEILNLVLQQLQLNIQLLRDKQYELLEEKYLRVLYKKNVPSMFKNSQNVLFMGKIVGISSEGKLQIELNDETIQEFGLKEVSFV
ncbi:biotin--[acetyl-CoA-carboxylase] ligase [Tenacibaculum adriaticum]|nr:biotin--[acetyl-CoA-carboxylase] ligase [Tenacibaculum adriaticum]